MHQCHDALMWSIITLLHYRYNASTLWCIKHLMCQCDLLYIMFAGMMCWDAVWWMGDAWYDAVCDEWVIHGWCISGVMCYVNEWMNEWTNEWANEWMNEWWINECVGGQCRMTVCISLYFICICNMSLYLFKAFYMWRINPSIHPRTSVCRSRTNPTGNI